MRELWHGTFSGYNTHRCRCSDCRAVKARYAAEWRAAHLEHYRAYHRDWQRANYAKKKAEAAK
jgi:hypothetical protein